MVCQELFGLLKHSTCYVLSGQYDLGIQEPESPHDFCTATPTVSQPQSAKILQPLTSLSASSIWILPPSLLSFNRYVPSIICIDPVLSLVFTESYR